MFTTKNLFLILLFHRDLGKFKKYGTCSVEMAKIFQKFSKFFKIFQKIIYGKFYDLGLILIVSYNFDPDRIEEHNDDYVT